MNKPDIRPDHLKIVQDILNKSLSSDVKVWVYGSRAKWTTLDSSDLDLALESKDKIDDKIIAQLKRDFEESNLPYEVDVVDIAEVQSFFRDIINKDKVLLDRYTPIKDKKLVPKGWQEMKLSDVMDIIGGGTPNTNTPGYWNGCIPWLSISDLNNSNRLVFKTEKTITRPWI